MKNFTIEYGVIILIVNALFLPASYKNSEELKEVSLKIVTIVSLLSTIIVDLYILLFLSLFNKNIYMIIISFLFIILSFYVGYRKTDLRDNVKRGKIIKTFDIAFNVYIIVTLVILILK